ncbi:hypothetical protein FNV43_RR14299 [Rhamnella rubrinervis]|uniref:Uncharacterized protein n=1 Tax=Rhamnella rubrinervis TaxID=2594499 RepID=A0A8K0MG72_9ROSA|nr:hypothetical protein FNV43_RR14299 [Rhamnella rubrinervis]
MATEADTAGAVSHTKREGEDIYLTTAQFESTSTECFLAEFNKSEGQFYCHSEFKEFERTSSFETRKDTIKSNFGISEGGSFLEPLSAPKVADDKVSSLEHCQADELNQSEREMSENENWQQKGEQLGTSEEIRREEYEQTEEDIKTAEQDHKRHDILKVMVNSPQIPKTGDPKFKIEEEDTMKNNVTVEQYIEVISNQPEPSKESKHSTEEETKGLDKDEIQMEDKSTDLSSNEVLNEATMDQNGESSACQLIVNSFNKDAQSATNACTKEGNVTNTSSTDAIPYQEEFGEEGLPGVMNKEADTSFDLAGEEKGPEANGSSRKMAIEKDEKDNIIVNSIENDSIPNVAANQEIQNDEEPTFKTGDIVKEKLEMESVTESREQEAQIEEEEKNKEAPTKACNIKIQDTTESNERENDGALVDNEMHDNNITGSSEQEAGVDKEEKHKEAPTTASNKKIQDTTVSEEPENVEDYEGLESSKLAGHPESSSLQQNEPELELNVIAEQLEIAARKDDVITTTCIKRESNEPKITGKDLTEEQDNEKDAERLKEKESSTKIRKEGGVNELSPEFIQEDSTATSNDEEDEAEKSREEIVKESVTAGECESISREINENVKRSVDVSSVKQDEDQEEEARELSPSKASIEKNRDDTLSAKLTKDDEHNTLEATEKRVRVESKDKEDSEKAPEKDEPEEKLEKLPHVTSEETSTEPPTENASSITCKKTEGTIQDFEETPKTEKVEEKTKDMDHTESTVKEVLVTSIAGHVTSEQKLGETNSVKDLFLEFTKERSIEENTKKDQELTGLETALLSTETGKQNLEKQAVSELYSALTGKETVEDSSKEVENNPMNLMEKNENKNSEPREQNEETDLTEEKKLDDSSKSKRDNYATTTSEHLEEEMHAEQSKKSLVQNSSFVSETHEKVIKEEIQDKGATILNSDSVQARILSEEVGLKEAEPENKDQIICSDIAIEEKGLASNVDFEVQEVQKSNTEANVEEIPASESGEQIRQEIEDKTLTTRIEIEEKKATSETFLDDTTEDNIQDSSKVPSIENEAITTEASDQSENAPARDESLHENVKAPFTEPTKEEIQLLNKDESIQHNGVSNLESYDAVKETENEEIQRQMDQQLHMALEQINDINSPELGDVGISKMEEAAEFAYKNEVSNLETLKEEKLSNEVSTSSAVHTCMDSEKAILENNGSDNTAEGSLKSEVQTTVESEENTNKNDELPTIKVFETTNAVQQTRESDSLKDYSPEFSFKEQPERSTKEDEAIVGMETTPASTKIGTEDLDEEEISEVPSSLLGGETIKEILKDNKNALMNLEEERKSTHLDSKEQLEATDLKEETKYQILEENMEPDNDLYAMRTAKILGQDSSFLSNVSKEVIEEEIQEEESIVHNSNSAVGIVSEDTWLKKGELEDKEHVKGFTIEPEEKGSAVSATLDAKPEENSSTEENREKILTVAYDGGEKVEKMEENMDTGTEEEKKITTRETSSRDMPGDYLLTTEATDGSDEVTNFPEEAKRETLEDNAGPNKELYATITTKALEEELTEQSNKNFVQNSSSEAEVSQKVLEDATQDKGPVICNSNSVSAGIVTEKTCLQDVEPENKEQVRNFDIALKEKGLESHADIEIQQEKSSNPEENGEKQIPADADKSREEIGHEMENETSVRIESEEKNTTSEILLDNIPEDNLQDSYTESSIVKESMTAGASDRSEKTPPRDKNLHEDAKTPTIDPSKEALQLLKEDESILPDDGSTLESYDIVKGIGNEEIQKQRDQQLHEPHEHINDINSSESGDVAISNIEEATDFAYETEVSKLEILKDEKLSIEDSTNIAVGTCMDSAKEILKHQESDNNSEGSLKGEVKTAFEVETNTNKNDELLAKKVSETTNTGQETREMDSVKDYSPEFANKEQPEGNTEEDKVLVGMVTALSSTKIGKQDLGEQESSEISSSLLGGETAEEILKDAKNVQMDLKEERKDAHSYSKEQLDVKLEKNSEPYEEFYDMRTIEATDEVTRAEESNTVLVQDSSFVSEVSEKLNEEEIQEIEPTVYSSNSLSAGTVSEKTGLKKDEPGDGAQVKSCTIVPEEKSSASSATIDVKPGEKFKEESREEILTAANDGGGKTKDKMEESLDAGTEEEKKIDILEVDLSTTKAMKRIDETPAGNKVTDLTEETKDEIIEDNAGSDKELYATTTTEALKEEKTAEQSHKTLFQNSSIVAEVSEEVIQKEIQDKGPPIFNSDFVSTGLVIEETDLKEVEQENKEQIQSSDISSEEKGLGSIVDIEIPQEKNSNLEENEEKEIPVVNESGEKIEHKMGTDKNFEAGLSGAEVEKEAAELKAKNTKNNELQREENLESAYPGQMIASTSESVSQDQVEKTLPLTPHTESKPVEQQVVAQSFHGELEIQMETEPRMKAEDQIGKIDCTNETTKAVTLTEEHEEIKKAEKSESTEVQVIDGESNLKSHPVDERTYEEKESSAVFGEYIKEQDSNEPTPSMSSQSEEDIISKKRETSATKAPEEEKIEDEESTKPVDVGNAVAEEGKYEEEIKVDSATETGTTSATNFDDAQLVDKPVQEETKTALDVGDTDETRQTLTNETEKEVDEPCKAVSPCESRSITVIAEDEIVNDQALPTGISDEQPHAKPSTFFAEEQKRETTTTIKELEKQSTKEVDGQDNEDVADSSATDLLKEEHRELNVSELAVESLGTNETEEEIKTTPGTVSESGFQGIEAASRDELVSDKIVPNEPAHGTVATIETRDEEKKKEVDLLDNQDSSAAHLQKEEHEELKVSELAVERPGTNETVSESEVQSIEAASQDDILDDKIVPASISNTSKEACIEKGEPKELKISDVIEEIPGADETEEEIKDASETVSKSHYEKIEVATDEKIITDQTFPEEISKEQLQGPSSTLLPREQEDETTATTSKVEEEDKKEVEILGNANIVDYSSPKAAEDISLEKDGHRELKVSELTVAMLGADKKFNEFDTVPENNSSNIEVLPVDKDETIIDEALPAEKSPEKLQLPLSTLLSNKQEHDSTSTIEKTEEDMRVVTETSNLNIEAASRDEVLNDKIVPNEPAHGTVIKTRDEENIKEVDSLDNEDSSAAHLLKEEHREFKVSELAVESLGTNETEEDIKTTPGTVSESVFQSIEAASRDELVSDKIVPNEPAHGTVPTIETRDEENKKEVALLDNQDSSAAHLQKEEHEELKASELAVEWPGTNETVSESVFQSIEAASLDDILDDKNVPAVTSNTSKEACIEKGEPKELKISDVIEEIPGADETEEEKKDASETVSKSHYEKIEVVTDEKIITDQTFPEEISNKQLQVPSSTLLPREQEDETTATTSKVEEEDKKEEEILGNANIIDYSSPKTTEDISLEKDGHREVKVSELTVAMLGADEKFNEFDTVSENNSSNIEVLPVEKDEIIIDQALPVEISSEKLQLPLSTLLPNEQEHDRTTTIEKTEEDMRVLTETSNLNIDASEIPSDLVSEKVQNHGEFTETEDTEIKNNNLEVAETNLRSEENQSETTNEANKTIKDEILDEEIKEDKQVTDDSQPVSLGENVQESHQEIVSNSEYQGENMEGTPKASTNGSRPELSEVDEKGNASGTIEELITGEAKSVKNHEQLSVEDKTIQENSPDEAEGKNVKEEAKNLDHQNQRDEINFKNITTDVTSTREKESIEISTEQSTLSLKEADEVTSEIKQLEKSSHATLEKESSREEDHNKSTPTRITTGDKDAQPMLPDPIEETTHRTEPKETEPQNDTWADTEIKGEEREIERETGGSDEKTTESTSTKISLSDLIESSTKQTEQVTEEKEPTVEKEAEAEHGEAKKDDEEGEEHKGSEPEGDVPVMVETVEASRDADVKVAHKKSHNILSGVGSKVKHSISKVKKAITGKSSHSKQANKKPDDPSS